MHIRYGATEHSRARYRALVLICAAVCARALTSPAWRRKHGDAIWQRTWESGCACARGQIHPKRPAEYVWSQDEIKIYGIISDCLDRAGHGWLDSLTASNTELNGATTDHTWPIRNRTKCHASIDTISAAHAKLGGVEWIRIRREQSMRCPASPELLCFVTKPTGRTIMFCLDVLPRSILFE